MSLNVTHTTRDTQEPVRVPSTVVDWATHLVQMNTGLRNYVSRPSPPPPLPHTHTHTK